MNTVVFKDGSKDAMEKIRNLGDAALTEAAIIAAGECIVRCPVDTGHLRGSISYITKNGQGRSEDNCWPGKPGAKIRKGRKTPDKCREDQRSHPGMMEGSAISGEAFIGTNVSYAPHVEYGTKFQKAQSFMRTGMTTAAPKIESRLRQRLGEEIKVTRFEEVTNAV